MGSRFPKNLEGVGVITVGSKYMGTRFPKNLEGGDRDPEIYKHDRLRGGVQEWSTSEIRDRA